MPWVRHGTPSEWPVMNALCMYAIGRVMLIKLAAVVTEAGVGAVEAAKASPTHAQTPTGVDAGNIFLRKIGAP